MCFTQIFSLNGLIWIDPIMRLLECVFLMNTGTLKHYLMLPFLIILFSWLSLGKNVACFTLLSVAPVFHPFSLILEMFISYISHASRVPHKLLAQPSNCIIFFLNSWIRAMHFFMLYFFFAGDFALTFSKNTIRKFPKICRYVGSLCMIGKVSFSFQILTVIFLTTPRATVYYLDPIHLALWKATLILLPW